MLSIAANYNIMLFSYQAFSDSMFIIGKNSSIIFSVKKSFISDKKIVRLCMKWAFLLIFVCPLIKKKKSGNKLSIEWIIMTFVIFLLNWF